MAKQDVNKRHGFGFNTILPRRKEDKVRRLGDYMADQPNIPNLSNGLSELEQIQEVMNGSEKCGGGRRVIRKRIGGE